MALINANPKPVEIIAPARPARRELTVPPDTSAGWASSILSAGSGLASELVPPGRSRQAR